MINSKKASQSKTGPKPFKSRVVASGKKTHLNACSSETSSLLDTLSEETENKSEDIRLEEKEPSLFSTLSPYLRKEDLTRTALPESTTPVESQISIFLDHSEQKNRDQTNKKSNPKQFVKLRECIQEKQEVHRTQSPREGVGLINVRDNKYPVVYSKFHRHHVINLFPPCARVFEPKDFLRPYPYSRRGREVYYKDIKPKVSRAMMKKARRLKMTNEEYDAQEIAKNAAALYREKQKPKMTKFKRRNKGRQSKSAKDGRKSWWKKGRLLILAAKRRRDKSVSRPSGIKSRSLQTSSTMVRKAGDSSSSSSHSSGQLNSSTGSLRAGGINKFLKAIRQKKAMSSTKKRKDVAAAEVEETAKNEMKLRKYEKNKLQEHSPDSYKNYYEKFFDKYSHRDPNEFTKFTADLEPAESKEDVLAQFKKTGPATEREQDMKIDKKLENLDDMEDKFADFLKEKESREEKKYLKPYNFQDEPMRYSTTQGPSYVCFNIKKRRYGSLDTEFTDVSTTGNKVIMPPEEPRDTPPIPPRYIERTSFLEDDFKKTTREMRDFTTDESKVLPLPFYLYRHRRPVKCGHAPLEFTQAPVCISNSIQNPYKTTAPMVEVEYDNPEASESHNITDRLNQFIINRDCDVRGKKALERRARSINFQLEDSKLRSYYYDKIEKSEEEKWGNLRMGKLEHTVIENELQEAKFSLQSLERALEEINTKTGFEEKSKATEEFPYGKRYKPICGATLAQLKRELGQIDVITPKVNNKLLRKIPASFMINSRKETILLYFCKNYMGHFKRKFPQRKTQFFVVENEFGYSKMVSTYIHPAQLNAMHMSSLRQIVEFIGDYVKYVSLDNAFALPHRMRSPALVLKTRWGNCFEIANLIVSLLRGIEVDAYMVSGYANCDLANESIVRTSKEKTGSKEKDPLECFRVHCWVFIRGDRVAESTQDYFINPTSCYSYSMRDQRFLGIESVWNEKNYWINRTPWKQSTIRKIDLGDPCQWMKFLPYETIYSQKANPGRASFESSRKKRKKSYKHSKTPLPNPHTFPMPDPDKAGYDQPKTKCKKGRKSQQVAAQEFSNKVKKRSKRKKPRDDKTWMYGKFSRELRRKRKMELFAKRMPNPRLLVNRTAKPLRIVKRLAKIIKPFAEPARFFKVPPRFGYTPWSADYSVDQNRREHYWDKWSWLDHKERRRWLPFWLPQVDPASRYMNKCNVDDGIVYLCYYHDTINERKLLRLLGIRMKKSKEEISQPGLAGRSVSLSKKKDKIKKVKEETEKSELKVVEERKSGGETTKDEEILSTGSVSKHYFVDLGNIAEQFTEEEKTSFGIKGGFIVVQTEQTPSEGSNISSEDREYEHVTGLNKIDLQEILEQVINAREMIKPENNDLTIEDMIKSAIEMTGEEDADEKMNRKITKRLEMQGEEGHSKFPPPPAQYTLVDDIPVNAPIRKILADRIDNVVMPRAETVINQKVTSTNVKASFASVDIDQPRPPPEPETESQVKAGNALFLTDILQKRILREHARTADPHVPCDPRELRTTPAPPQAIKLDEKRVKGFKHLKDEFEDYEESKSEFAFANKNKYPVKEVDDVDLEMKILNNEFLYLKAPESLAVTQQQPHDSSGALDNASRHALDTDGSMWRGVQEEQDTTSEVYDMNRFEGLYKPLGNAVKAVESDATIKAAVHSKESNEDPEMMLVEAQDYNDGFTVMPWLPELQDKKLAKAYHKVIVGKAPVPADDHATLGKKMKGKVTKGIHMKMPKSWCPPPRLGNNEIKFNRYWNGYKRVECDDATYEHWPEERRADGMVYRMVEYDEPSSNVPLKLVEKFTTRIDRMVCREYDYKTKEFKETFSLGRPDSIKTHRFFSNKLYSSRVIEFHDDESENVDRIEMSVNGLRAVYKNRRDDFLSIEVSYDEKNFFPLQIFGQRVKRKKHKFLTEEYGKTYNNAPNSVKYKMFDFKRAHCLVGYHPNDLRVTDKSRTIKRYQDAVQEFIDDRFDKTRHKGYYAREIFECSVPFIDSLKSVGQSFQKGLTPEENNWPKIAAFKVETEHDLTKSINQLWKLEDTISKTIIIRNFEYIHPILVPSVYDDRYITQTKGMLAQEVVEKYELKMEDLLPYNDVLQPYIHLLWPPDDVPGKKMSQKSADYLRGLCSQDFRFAQLYRAALILKRYEESQGLVEFYANKFKNMMTEMEDEEAAQIMVNYCNQVLSDLKKHVEVMEHRMSRHVNLSKLRLEVLNEVLQTDVRLGASYEYDKWVSNKMEVDRRIRLKILEHEKKCQGKWDPAHDRCIRYFKKIAVRPGKTVQDSMKRSAKVLEKKIMMADMEDVDYNLSIMRARGQAPTLIDATGRAELKRVEVSKKTGMPKRRGHQLKPRSLLSCFEKPYVNTNEVTKKTSVKAKHQEYWNNYIKTVNKEAKNKTFVLVGELESMAKAAERK